MFYLSKIKLYFNRYLLYRITYVKMLDIIILLFNLIIIFIRYF